MRRSDPQLEENYDEYLRLLQNDDYLDVTRDEESGGVSAVHKLHKFDKQIGAFGILPASGHRPRSVGGRMGQKSHPDRGVVI